MPRRNPNNKRSVISVAVHQDEWGGAQQEAARLGLHLATWVRHLIRRELGMPCAIPDETTTATTLHYPPGVRGLKTK